MRWWGFFPSYLKRQRRVEESGEQHAFLLAEGFEQQLRQRGLQK